MFSKSLIAALSISVLGGCGYVDFVHKSMQAMPVLFTENPMYATSAMLKVDGEWRCVTPWSAPSHSRVVLKAPENGVGSYYVGIADEKSAETDSKGPLINQILFEKSKGDYYLIQAGPAEFNGQQYYIYGYAKVYRDVMVVGGFTWYNEEVISKHDVKLERNWKSVGLYFLSRYTVGATPMMLKGEPEKIRALLKDYNPEHFFSVATCWNTALEHDP